MSDGGGLWSPLTGELKVNETESSHTTAPSPAAHQTEPSSVSAFVDLLRTPKSRITRQMNAMFTFLLVQLFVVAAVSLDADKGTFAGFQNRHLYTEMFDNMCTEVMRKRNIALKSKCKPINSFIRAESAMVKSICKRDGKKTSEQLFDVVKCCLKQSSPKHPNCQYQGFFSRQKITVKCENREPVHFYGPECPSEINEFGFQSLE
ncbi:ribonuclease pancreatic-like [Neosynchiropus ocellatus]